MLANLHAFAGWCPEALAEADRTNCRFDCGQVYGLCGRRALALEFARNREAALEHQYVDPVHIAWIYAALGDKERTLQWYEEGYRTRSPMMVYLKVDASVARASPTLNDDLYNAPRFQDLLRCMNFPL